MRSRGQCHIRGRQQPGEGQLVGDEPRELDGQTGGAAFEPTSHRPVPRNHQPGVDSVVAQHGKRVDAPVHVLLDRQSAAVDQERLIRPRPPSASPGVTPIGMKGPQIHAERHSPDIARADPVELFAGELGGAHHRVVRLRGAAVCHVGQPPRGLRRHHLTEHAVEAFVGDHRAGDISAPSPLPEPTQRQPVGHLDGVGSHGGGNIDHGPHPRHPISPGERNPGSWDGDPHDSGRQLLLGVQWSRNDQRHVVPCRAVTGPELIHRSPEAPGPGAVEVRDLHHSHPRTVSRAEELDASADRTRTQQNVNSDHLGAADGQRPSPDPRGLGLGRSGNPSTAARPTSAGDARTMTSNIGNGHEAIDSLSGVRSPRCSTVRETP